LKFNLAFQIIKKGAMIIKNHDALVTTRSRKQVLEIIEAGIRRVLPANIMSRAVKYDTASRILVVNSDSFHIADLPELRLMFLNVKTD
jgi:uncharacterized protein YqgQ